MEDLRRKKIDGLVSMNGHIFPDVMKAFYTNLSYNNGVISSFVRGNSFLADAGDLGKILGIPSKGLEFIMNKTIALKDHVKMDFYYGIGRKTKIKCFKNVKRNLVVSFLIGPLGILEKSILMIGYYIIS